MSRTSMHILNATWVYLGRRSRPACLRSSIANTGDHHHNITICTPWWLILLGLIYLRRYVCTYVCMYVRCKGA